MANVRDFISSSKIREVAVRGEGDGVKIDVLLKPHAPSGDVLAEDWAQRDPAGRFEALGTVGLLAVIGKITEGGSGQSVKAVGTAVRLLSMARNELIQTKGLGQDTKEMINSMCGGIELILPPMDSGYRERLTRFNSTCKRLALLFPEVHQRRKEFYHNSVGDVTPEDNHIAHLGHLYFDCALRQKGIKQKQAFDTVMERFPSEGQIGDAMKLDFSVIDGYGRTEYLRELMSTGKIKQYTQELDQGILQRLHERFREEAGLSGPSGGP